MTFRIGLNTRIGLAVRGSQAFAPTQLSGCVLWLRSDLGVTTVDTTIVDENNMAGASWSRSSSPASDAQTVRDTNDAGTPTLHYITQVGGVRVNRTAIGTAEFKSGTKTWVYYASPNGVIAYINLATGALGTVTGGTASVQDAGSGWWRVTLEGICTSGQAVVIGPASGNGGLSYAGDGTGTILCREVSIIQRTVSAWADQSGNGKNAAQATEANQLMLFPAGAGDRPYLFSSNTPSSTWMTTPTGVITAQPYSVFIVASSDGIGAGLKNLMDGTTADSADIRRYGTPSEIYAGSSILVGPNISTATTTWIAEFNGASSAISIGASRTTGTTGTVAPNGITIGTWAGGVSRSWEGKIYEYAIWNHQIDTIERAKLLNYAATRYNI